MHPESGTGGSGLCGPEQALALPTVGVGEARLWGEHMTLACLF